MALVNTVRGPIDAAQLGVTLMHEHVFVLSTEVMQNFPEPWGDEEKRVADAVARLNELKSRGVDSIVDLTVIGLGRYIPRIQRIAAQTEVNIIVATGVYTYNDVPMYFHYQGPGTVLGGDEFMTDMFVRDIEQGIADTGVKAAILKCATDVQGVTPGVERGMDRFGIDVLLPFEDRVNTVAKMCDLGYAAKMVLSQDASCFMDALPEAALPVMLPNWHYLHIHNDVIPALKQRGVTDEQIETMLVDNPRKIFERQGSY